MHHIDLCQFDRSQIYRTAAVSKDAGHLLGNLFGLLRVGVVATRTEGIEAEDDWPTDMSLSSIRGTTHAELGSSVV